MGETDTIRWGEVARRIQESDLQAEEQFGAFFYPRVLAMATIRLGDLETAREIAQESVLAALQAVRESKVREPEKLPAFVYGTARNLVNNHFRARSERPDHVPLNPDQAAPGNLAVEMDVEERRQMVRDALERIKAVDRQILLLTLVDGMNPREIAPQVGLSAENVRTRKARAIKAIIEEIKKLSRK